jgi:hypothetical protein
MVSDDMLAFLSSGKPAEPAPAPFDPNRTQHLPPNADRTQKLGPSDTQPIPVLDPNFRPEDTQVLGAAPHGSTDAEKKTDAQVTQRLDDSIWRLQEARRILAGLPQKS